METQNAPVTMVLNFQDAGTQNMDFDFMKFLLQCFKYYYPGCLREILVYGVPAKLSASWRAVRGYMDAKTLANTITVTVETIREFIPAKYLPRYMGGEDDFTFTMEELARCIPTRALHTQVVTEKPPLGASQTSTSVFNDIPVQKRSVTFHDDPTNPGRSAPLTVGSQAFQNMNGGYESTTASNTVQQRQTGMQPNGSTLNPTNGNSTRSRKNSTSSNSGRRSASSALRNICDRRMQTAPDNVQIGGFISVSPREDIVLTKIEGEEDPVDCVTITNTSDIPLMYKTKTTSPEKFRVRPSVGIVKPGGMDHIKVVLQKEYRNTIKHERFLVLAVRTVEQSTSDFSKIFEASLPANKFETRLNCTLDHAASFSDDAPSNVNKTKNGVQESVKLLTEQVQKLTAQQNLMFAVLVVMMIAQAITFLYLVNRTNAPATASSSPRSTGDL
ncbi:Mospd2 protein [Aphelenchoides avenae]|nr:Mospd2 protein [Aphelenchus avenae]